MTLLEGKDLSIDTVIESADTLKADKGDEFILPGAAGTLWHADFAENKLVLDLYNIEDGTLPAAEGSKFTLSSAMTDDGTVRLTVTPKEGVTFWGYDVTFEDEDLVLYCKQKPQLSTTEKPLTGVSVVIDPGHGGYDPGSLGAAYGYGPTEDEINMAYALATEQILAELGADVTLTLYPDQLDEKEEKLVLFDRMKIAKEADADIFISMHHNSVDATADANNVTGLEAYYFTDRSKALAADIATSISASTGRPNRGDAQSYYVVTKMTYCPAVLTEIGYIVNPAEYEELLRLHQVDPGCTGLISFHAKTADCPFGQPAVFLCGGNFPRPTVILDLTMLWRVFGSPPGTGCQTDAAWPPPLRGSPGIPIQCQAWQLP